MASVPRATALGLARALRVLTRPQLRSIRPLVATKRTYSSSTFRNTTVNQIGATTTNWSLHFTRGFAAGITETDLKDRVLQVLKLFDKVNPEKVSKIAPTEREPVHRDLCGCHVYLIRSR